MWLQRLQGLGVVPVQNVPMIGRNTVESVHRIATAGKKIASCNEPQIACGQCRDEKHADIRRRSAMCDLFLMAVLIVVRRQPVVIRTNKGFKEVPCPSCNKTQEMALFFVECFAAKKARTRAPDGNFRGQQPKHQNRQGRPEPLRIIKREMPAQRQRQRRRGPHQPPGCAADIEIRQRGRGMGRRGPFQPVSTRDADPPERPKHRIKRDQRIADQKNNGKKPAPAFCFQLVNGGAKDAASYAPRRDGEQLTEKVAAGRGDRQQCPDQCAARQHQPCAQEKQQQRRRHKTAAQVVHHLPAVKRRERVYAGPAAAVWNSASQPRQQLPVAAHPAMLAHCEIRICRGQIFIENKIAGKCCPPVQTLEQIMAENVIFRNAPCHYAMQCGDIVNTLADKDPGTKEVLIDVRHCPTVDINCGIAAIKMREMCVVAELWQNFDARLQDRMACNDPTAVGVGLSPVQRMRHDPDQAVCHTGRHLRVRIQCYRETRAAQDICWPGRDGKGVCVLAQHQPVEFFKLSALALPCHPAVFGDVEIAPAVQ